MLSKAKIERITKNLEWNVDWEINNGNKWVTFSKFSPYGQDFNIELYYVNYDQLVDELDRYYENFDVSSEAYLWLDSDGHGKNGAPYEMIDVYNDMKACEEMMYELYQALEDARR